MINTLTTYGLLVIAVIGSAALLLNPVNGIIMLAGHKPQAKRGIRFWFRSPTQVISDTLRGLGAKWFLAAYVYLIEPLAVISIIQQRIDQTIVGGYVSLAIVIANWMVLTVRFLSGRSLTQSGDTPAKKRWKLAERGVWTWPVVYFWLLFLAKITA